MQLLGFTVAYDEFDYLLNNATDRTSDMPIS